MLLAIDVGNTNITLGVYKDDELLGTYRLTTWFKRTSDEYGFMINNFLQVSKVDVNEIEDVITLSINNNDPDPVDPERPWWDAN